MSNTRIMTHQILNQDTGELEHKEYSEKKDKSKLKGGFILMYPKTYEEVQEAVLKSNTDIKVFHWITNRFTYKISETSLLHKDCPTQISQPMYSKLIAKLIDEEYLKRISKGIYRLNPYIYLPYHADGEALQEEWKSLCGLSLAENYKRKKPTLEAGSAKGK